MFASSRLHPRHPEAGRGGGRRRAHRGAGGERGQRGEASQLIFEGKKILEKSTQSISQSTKSMQFIDLLIFYFFISIFQILL